VSYGYNNGLRVALTNALPTGAWTNGYRYDGARRLSSITCPAGTFSYLYQTGVGGASASPALVRKLTLATSAYITNTFDSSGPLLSTRPEGTRRHKGHGAQCWTGRRGTEERPRLSLRAFVPSCETPSRSLDLVLMTQECLSRCFCPPRLCA
jgi:YD repeat-containing protein